MMKASNHLALILVGDELLSGRRADKHLGHMTQLCEARGLEIVQVWMAGDDEAVLAQIIRDAQRPCPAAGASIPVISFGGIGGTPDDRTREAAAAAFDRPLELHTAALQLLQARYGEAELHDQRLNMIRFPAGAELIPNPVNQVPGFFIGRNYFVPGFPQMGWPMAEWALDREFAEQTFEPPVTLLLRAEGARESDYVATMLAVRAAYPAVKVSSLPHMEAGSASHIEFGFRGAETDADKARTLFADHAARRGFSLEVLD